MTAIRIDLSRIKETFSNKEKMKTYIESERNKGFSLPKRYSNAFTVETLKNMKVLFTKEEGGLIVYIPGGGFVSNPSFFQLQFALDMAKKTKRTVATLIYPKVPNHSRDDIVGSVKEVIKSLQERQKEFSVVSDSAGSAIALSVIEELGMLPKSMVYLSPNVDLRYKNPWQEELEKIDEMLAYPGVKILADLYKRPYKRNNPKVSPVLLPTLSDVPSLIVVGKKEMMLHDARLLKEQYKKHGNKCSYYEVEDMMHDFMFYPMEQGKKYKEIVFSYLQKEEK